MKRAKTGSRDVTGEGRSQRCRMIAVSVILLHCLLLLVIKPRGFFFDDSYYYLTVARNIADGYGSTFDRIGETNGYHPLWLGIGVVAFRLAHSAGCDVASVVPTMIMGLSILLYLAVTLLTFDIVIRRYSPKKALLITLIANLGFPAISNMLNGLETPLSVFFILLLCNLRARGFHSRRPLVFAICCVLAVLARIEVALVIAYFGFQDFVRPTSGGGAIRRLLVYLPAASSLAGYFCFSHVRFGSWQATSSVAKQYWSGYLFRNWFVHLPRLKQVEILLKSLYFYSQVTFPFKSLARITHIYSSPWSIPYVLALVSLTAGFVIMFRSYIKAVLDGLALRPLFLYCIITYAAYKFLLFMPNVNVEDPTAYLVGDYQGAWYFAPHHYLLMIILVAVAVDAVEWLPGFGWFRVAVGWRLVLPAVCAISFGLLYGELWARARLVGGRADWVQFTFQNREKDRLALGSGLPCELPPNEDLIIAAQNGGGIGYQTYGKAYFCLLDGLINSHEYLSYLKRGRVIDYLRKHNVLFVSASSDREETIGRYEKFDSHERWEMILDSEPCLLLLNSQPYAVYRLRYEDLDAADEHWVYNREAVASLMN